MTGLFDLKSSILNNFLHDFSVCNLGHGNFHQGAVLFNSPKQFSRAVLSSKIEEPQEKTGASLLW